MAGAPQSLPEGKLRLVSQSVAETRLLSLETVRRTSRGAEATVVLIGRGPTAIDQRYALEAKRELVDCPGRRIAQERAAYFDQDGKPAGTAFLTGDNGRDVERSDAEVPLICGQASEATEEFEGWRAIQREVQAPPEGLLKHADGDRQDATAWAWVCASEARGRWRPQALADCDHALALQPAATALQRDQAYLKLIIGQRAPAVAEFHKVLAVEPRNAAALYGLSLAAAQSGDKGGSRALRGKAFDLDPKIADWVQTTYKIQIGDAYATREPARNVALAGMAVRSWIMNRWPPSKNCRVAPGIRPAIRSWVAGRAMPS